MSYTEIYSFDKNGNANAAGEVHNSWRGAMTIWGILEERYLPPFVPEYLKSTNWYRPDMTPDQVEEQLGYKPSRCAPPMGNENPIQEIWDLADNTTIPEHERIVLFTTFDNCLLRKENIPKVVAAFRQFGGETSLPEQADILEQLVEEDDCMAVGWNQTSVNGDTWATSGGYDEETDEGIPYNCMTGDKHYWLFDALSQITPEEEPK